MKSAKTVRIGGYIYAANEEIEVSKEDVPAFQSLGFKRSKSKPAPKPILETEIHTEEELNNG